ncbi:uncharacterized protein LOC125507003 [Triticum urartu]|uniref:uncharacterized protein LOC125507003 n=1 Tax=Triticum urartu TaxID=4572 RepID=UPI0020448914|nr:uncharacterized protein LOC125507003 [Triticum urartu]
MDEYWRCRAQTSFSSWPSSSTTPRLQPMFDVPQAGWGRVDLLLLPTKLDCVCDLLTALGVMKMKMKKHVYLMSDLHLKQVYLIFQAYNVIYTEAKPSQWRGVEEICRSLSPCRGSPRLPTPGAASFAADQRRHHARHCLRLAVVPLCQLPPPPRAKPIAIAPPLPLRLASLAGGPAQCGLPHHALPPVSPASRPASPPSPARLQPPPYNGVAAAATPFPGRASCLQQSRWIKAAVRSRRGKVQASERRKKVVKAVLLLLILSKLDTPMFCCCRSCIIVPTICLRKTENASNTIAMGARPGFHIFFGVIRRKPRPDHIASSKDKRSNVASANFAGRPSTVVSVDFAARPSAVASADFAGRPSVVISAYFAAGIFFFCKL